MQNDALKAALGDIKGWAKKGMARDAGRRHGLTLPEDSDFPEAVEEQPEEELETAPVVAVEAEGVSPEDLEQILALMADEED